MKTFGKYFEQILGDFFALTKRSGGMIAYSLVMYILFLISYERGSEDWMGINYSPETLLAYGAPFLVLTYVLLYHFQGGRGLKARFPVALIPAVLLAWWVSKGISVLMTPPLIVTSIFLSLVLLVVTQPQVRRDDKALVAKTYDVTVGLAGTLALGFTLMLLVWGVLESVSFLLEINIMDKYKMYVEVFVPFVIMPLLYRMLEARLSLGQEGDGSPIFNVAFNYILTYATFVYTVIILLYLLKCLVTLTVPNGVFATICIVLFLLGLLVYISPSLPYRPTKFATCLAGLYKWAMIPTLLLYGWAVGVRVMAYGLTEARVYLVALGMIMAVTTVCLFWSPEKVYRTTLYACLMVLGGLSYNFVFSPQKLSYYSQEARMYSLAKDLGYFDAQTGKLISVDEINAKGNETDERVREFKRSYRYVTSQGEDAEKIFAKYGKLDEDKIVYKETFAASVERKREVWLQHTQQGWLLDVTPYTSIYSNPDTRVRENAEVEIRVQGDLLLKCHADSLLKEVGARYNLEAYDGAVTMEEVIVVRCQTYDLFFRYLSLQLDGEKWHINGADVDLVGVLKGGAHQ